jgi:hypothetical protein
MLRVTVYALRGADDPKIDPEGTEYNEIDYVSLVNNETYGPPALVAPNREATRASIGDRVLYINTALVPLFEIERTSD